MSSERPFFYRTSDPVQNLHLRVQIRPSSRHDTTAENEGTPLILAQSFKWQQKVFAPYELSKYCYFCDTHASGTGGFHHEYIQKLRAAGIESREKCLSDLEAHGVYLYTYIDRDGIVLDADKCSQTSSAAAVTPFAEGVMHLPSTSVASLSSAAAEVHKRVTRESNFQVMYVMAAVASNHSKVRQILFQAQSSSIGDVANGDFAHEGPWRRLQESNLVQERMLCAVKMHRGGALEVLPGLSESEPESDDDAGPFCSASSAKKRLAQGAKLSTFMFSVLSDNVSRVFEYSLENVNAEVDFTRIEEIASDERSHLAVSSSRHQSFVMPEATALKEPGATLALLRMRLEVVSALGFDADNLFCEFQILLPKGWRVPSSEVSGWCTTEQGELACFGSSQIATAVELPVGENDFEEASNLTATALGAGLSVLVAGFFLGIGSVFILGAGVLFTLSAYAKSPPRVATEMMAHFGVPLNLTVSPSSRVKLGGLVSTECPLLLFQVSSVDWFGRHRIQGYGYTRMPITAGSVDVETVAWIPSGTVEAKLSNFFLGGAHRLKDLRFVAQPPNANASTAHKRRFASRLGFTTRSTGRVRIRAHTIEQYESSTTESRPEDDDSHTHNWSRRVENLINRYSTDGPVAALSDLEGDTTAEKASAYIRELQSRRSQTYMEHRNNAAKGLGPEPEAQF